MKSILIIATFFLTSLIGTGSFLAEQLKHDRVRLAQREKENVVKARLQKFGLIESNLNILMVAYKDEYTLELYAKRKTETVYELIQTYKVCMQSGTLGPKRKNGDNQVPEGFYEVSLFNPVSGYFLSLKLNYPNESDRIISNGNDPGGDIFIHGKCISISSLPMTDEKIKEIYLYAVHARNNGQTEIPVYVFPFRMTNENIQKFNSDYANNPELIKFWENLKPGYDFFEKNKTVVKFNVSQSGEYLY